MDVALEPTWKTALNPIFQSDSFTKLADFVKQEYQQHQVFPPGKQIFSAFWQCPLPSVKVVILGQDPYHGEGQANGLAFSVAPGLPFPPSLLNATLTVRADSAGSHQNQGWESVTDAVIQTISREREGVVFLLWGAYAQKKEELIDSKRHCILKAPHPSPLAAHRGFWGCKHFSKANDYLLASGQIPISW